MDTDSGDPFDRGVPLEQYLHAVLRAKLNEAGEGKTDDGAP
jgi:hypothetical protein